MKHAMIFALVAGFCAVAVLVAVSGLGDVASAVASIGWGALGVALARAAAVIAAGLGWYVIAPRGSSLTLKRAMGLRFVREGTNMLLPLAAIGGDVIGARLLAQAGAPGGFAAAITIVDVMLQAATQLAFTLIGLGLLIWLGGDPAIVQAATVGVALAIPALGGFWLVQRQGGQRLIETLLRRLAGGRDWRIFGAIDVVYREMRELYAARQRLGLSFVVHLGGWIVGAFEIWIALRFMGHPLSFAEALVIESLAQALRGAVFIMPGALGVQEGGLIALCAVFGLTAPAALALSLVKRMADVVVGLPGLIAWQVLEGRRLAQRSRGRRAGSPEPVHKGDKA
jgi:putative membrane protein